MARTPAERALASLRRVDALDRRGPRLNAVPVLDPAFLGNVGSRPGPLAGRVFTAKDSFAVAGLPVGAGSPALARVVATDTATVVTRLRDHGAALLGKTTMPPVAIGGGQAGVHGRARSPFNPRYLAAAWHSGSSIGSAVSVAAGLCDLGLGEETVSSGRSPASNNAVVAYTPSWGVVPSTGNLPLHPYRDVVVPHTTDLASMLQVLAAIAGPDDEEVWQRQRVIPMGPATAVAELLRHGGVGASPLRGLRLGVPHLYVGESTATVAGIPIRRSIRRRWEETERVLLEAGVELVRVGLPLVEAYEERSRVRTVLQEESAMIAEWTAFELGPLMTHAWGRFLERYADGVGLADLSPGAIRPDVPYAVDAVESGRRHPGRDSFDFAAILAGPAPTTAEVEARAARAVAVFDRARRTLLDEWLDGLGLDALIFPANADVGEWDAESDPDAAAAAWRDGVVFSHGNHVLRRCGVPTVTVPIGLLDDIAMPVGATLCGRGWDDVALLRIATALEAVLPARAVPVAARAGELPPPLRSDERPAPGAALQPWPAPAVLARPDGEQVVVRVSRVDRPGFAELDGATHPLTPDSDLQMSVPRDRWDGGAVPLLLLCSYDGTAARAVELRLTRLDDQILIDLSTTSPGRRP